MNMDKKLVYVQLIQGYSCAIEVFTDASTEIVPITLGGFVDYILGDGIGVTLRIS